MIRRFSLLAIALAALGAVGVDGAWGQEAAREAKPAASQPQWMFGVGVKSDAGVTGEIVLKERSFNLAPRIVLQIAAIEFSLDETLAADSPAWVRRIAHLAEEHEGAEPPKAQVVHTASYQQLEEIRRAVNGRIVMKPQVMTLSGRRGVFEAMSQVPIIRQVGQGKWSVQQRPVGLRGVVTPVYRDGVFHIDLQLEHHRLSANSDSAYAQIDSQTSQIAIELPDGVGCLVGGIAPKVDGPPKATKAWVALVVPCLAPAEATEPVFDLAGEMGRFMPDGRRSSPLAPAPRASELRELHDEVKLLRRDLNRLIDLLEKRLDSAPPTSLRKDPSPPEEIKDVEARKVPDNSRVAPGSGLRINVPAMGPAPVALDFAFPIAKALTNDERIFSFFIGFER